MPLDNKEKNKIQINDTVYEITDKYREGVEACRKQKPWQSNPYRNSSEAYHEWDDGYVNEEEEYHIVDGFDVLAAPEDGTCFVSLT